MARNSTDLSRQLDAAARFAVAHLGKAVCRSPSVELERLLASRFELRRRQVRTVIRHLVNTGELAYTTEHGSSFLEISYHRPVKVGERVVLVPADRPYRSSGGEVVVRIAPGSSFGSGRHPTTRLAIRGIELAVKETLPADRLQDSAVLDIGTGTGVLAITAVKLGIGRGIGIDREACSRFEARQNVVLNQLADRIRIESELPDHKNATGRYLILAANLRLPTLFNLASSNCRLTRPPGRMVLSGIRVAEIDGLLDAYRAQCCKVLWVAEEDGWGAAVLQPSGR